MAELGDVGGPLSGTIAGAEGDYYPHIVDQLIAERGEKLFRSRALPIIKPFLYQILRYKEAVRMADAMAPLPGTAAMQYVSDLLSLDLDVSGLEHIPRSGAFIVVANHPTGIADGVAVYDALRPARPDISIFTNRDAIRINPRLSEFLIPVEWREAFRDRAKTKETLRISSAAFAGERAVVIFPSGRIAFWADKRLNERPWQASAVTLAKKQDVPIVPAHVYLLLHERGQLPGLSHDLLRRLQKPDGNWFSYFYPSPFYATRLFTELLTSLGEEYDRYMQATLNALLACAPTASSTQRAEILICLNHLQHQIVTHRQTIIEKANELVQLTLAAQLRDGSWPSEAIWEYFDQVTPLLVGFDHFRVRSTALCVRALKLWT